jgi:hypothetical protein
MVFTNAGSQSDTFTALYGTEMVDLYVGINKQHFRVHKNLLCAKVEYFSKMFTGSFSEAHSNSGTFSEDDPVAFGSLLTWVYQGDIPKTDHTKLNITEAISSWPTFSLYCLADKFCIPELMDHVMDSNVSTLLLGFLPTPKQVAYHYTDSPLAWRKCMSQHIAWRVVTSLRPNPDDNPVDSLAESLESNGDLLRDVLTLLREESCSILSPAFACLDKDDCLFHVHDKADTCPWKKNRK